MFMKSPLLFFSFYLSDKGVSFIFIFTVSNDGVPNTFLLIYISPNYLWLHLCWIPHYQQFTLLFTYVGVYIGGSDGGQEGASG